MFIPPFGEMIRFAFIAVKCELDYLSEQCITRFFMVDGRAWLSDGPSAS